MNYLEITINNTLRLIQLQPEQAGELFQLTDDNREYLGEFLPWVPHVTTVADSLAHIQETLEARASGTIFTYGIELNGEIVGTISLRNIQPDSPKEIEIGYWVSKDCAGKGIATTATQALTDFGVRVLGLASIAIRAHAQNIGSNKVAEKSGYVFEGEIDDEVYGKLNLWRFKP